MATGGEFGYWGVGLKEKTLVKSGRIEGNWRCTCCVAQTRNLGFDMSLRSCLDVVIDVRREEKGVVMMADLVEEGEREGRHCYSRLRKRE